MKKYLLVSAGLLAVVVVLGGVKFLQISTLIGMGENMQMPPTVISAAPVVEQEWEVTLHSVGSLEAVQGVTVTADTPGRVTEILFTPGTDVKKGDILIRQDISTEEAQLRSAEAAVSLAKANLERVSSLVERQVTSRSEFDAADAQYKQAVAQADNIRTIIAKKTVRAPFEGRLGIRMIDIGTDLMQGNPIVSLQAVDPIYVNFSLPQRDLAAIQKGLQLRLQTDAVPDKTFIGEVSTISPEVDPLTRNVRVQATLKNEDGLLLPGMYAKVEVVLPEMKQVLAVPSTAISFATYGDSVFKVVEKSSDKGGDAQQVAEQSFVQLGEMRGDYVAITAGVAPGDVIVTTGVFKLLNGAPVSINNDTQPEFSLNPTPKES